MATNAEIRRRAYAALEFDFLIVDGRRAALASTRKQQAELQALAPEHKGAKRVKIEAAIAALDALCVEIERTIAVLEKAPVSFRLRVISADEERMLYMRHGINEPSDAAAGVRMQRLTLEQSIIGWQGVTSRHVLLDAEVDEPFNFVEPGVLTESLPRDKKLERLEDIRLVLDAQEAWAVDLTVAVDRHRAERRRRLETAEKNSAAA